MHQVSFPAFAASRIQAAFSAPVAADGADWVDEVSHAAFYRWRDLAFSTLDGHPRFSAGAFVLLERAGLASPSGSPSDRCAMADRLVFHVDRCIQAGC